MNVEDKMKNMGLENEKNGGLGNINFAGLGNIVSNDTSTKDAAASMQENITDGINKVMQAVKYIEDVTVVSGRKNISAPAGYEKIDVDLNMKAGGNYIYLCVKRGGDEANAITAVTVVEGKGADAPAGYEKIDVDLNEKAGGKYLYLCKKRGGGKALEDIVIVYGDNNRVAAPEGYTRLNRDLNEKAGGKYIYLCYR